MRDDLLHAQASVDWAITNLEGFENRLKGWLDKNIYVTIVETPQQDAYNVLVAKTDSELPLLFNVEAGAYINAIRSALDILATSISKRERTLYPQHVYFPIAESEADFRSGNYKGAEFVRQLSGTSRKILESLQPYNGGNKLLYALHHLDILRKHKRLLATYMRPAKFNIMGWGLKDAYKPVSAGYTDAGNGETVFGLLAKGAQKPKIEYTAHVIFGETDVLAGEPLIGALHSFAGLTHTIIELFDTP